MRPSSQPGSPIPVFLKEQYYRPAADGDAGDVLLHRRAADGERPRGLSPRHAHGMVPGGEAIRIGQKTEGSVIRGSAYLDWGAVRLTPPEQFADDPRAQGPKGQPVPASLPPVAANDHYGRARETDSAIVETVDAKRGSHFEKFLFYRGIGNFELPIKLVALGNDRFEVTNSADEASGALLLVRIENDRVRFTRMDPISPRSTIEVDSAGRRVDGRPACRGDGARADCRGAVRKRSPGDGQHLAHQLVRRKRHAAVVPGAGQADRRAACRSRSSPRRTSACAFSSADWKQSRRKIASGWCTRWPAAVRANSPRSEAVKAELVSLGRFAEPAIQFVIGQTSDPTTRGRLEAILAEVRAASR